jgi:hypothetical protein
VVLERQSPHIPEHMKLKPAAMHSFVRSAFQIGQGFMLWQALLTFAGIPFELVMPAVWKKGMGIQVPAGGTDEERKKRRKQLAVQTAQRLFPKVDMRRNDRCRTPCPDKAEAILLAVYAARRLHGRGR